MKPKVLFNQWIYNNSDPGRDWPGFCLSTFGMMYIDHSHGDMLDQRRWLALVFGLDN